MGKDNPVDLITPEVIEAYQRDGVVYLPQALDWEWLMLIDFGIQRILNSSSPYIQTFFKDLPGEFVDSVRRLWPSVV